MPSRRQSKQPPAVPQPTAALTIEMNDASQTLLAGINKNVRTSRPRNKTQAQSSKAHQTSLAAFGFQVHPKGQQCPQEQRQREADEPPPPKRTKRSPKATEIPETQFAQLTQTSDFNEDSTASEDESQEPIPHFFPARERNLMPAPPFTPKKKLGLEIPSSVSTAGRENGRLGQPTSESEDSPSKGRGVERVPKPMGRQPASAVKKIALTNGRTVVKNSQWWESDSELSSPPPSSQEVPEPLFAAFGKPQEDCVGEKGMEKGDARSPAELEEDTPRPISRSQRHNQAAATPLDNRTPKPPTRDTRQPVLPEPHKSPATSAPVRPPSPSDESTASEAEDELPRTLFPPANPPPPIVIPISSDQEEDTSLHPLPNTEQALPPAIAHEKDEDYPTAHNDDAEPSQEDDSVFAFRPVQTQNFPFSLIRHQSSLLSDEGHSPNSQEDLGWMMDDEDKSQRRGGNPNLAPPEETTRHQIEEGRDQEGEAGDRKEPTPHRPLHSQHPPLSLQPVPLSPAPVLNHDPPHETSEGPYHPATRATSPGPRVRPADSQTFHPTIPTNSPSPPTNPPLDSTSPYYHLTDSQLLPESLMETFPLPPPLTQEIASDESEDEIRGGEYGWCSPTQ